jgi:hypothetical protein
MATQWLRCPATDANGLRCVRWVSHQGKHSWQQCPWTDAQGYPCFLPPGHPGDHELAWFARPTRPGTTHTLRHQGDERSARGEAAEDSHEFAFHHWFPVSETYDPGHPGAVAKAIGSLTTRHSSGELVVVYEYRPDQNAEPADD